MQTHKRLIARILSLVITSSMVLTTLPLSVLASDELSEKTEIIQESDKENSENGGGLVSKSTDGTGGTSEGTLGLGEGGTDTGGLTDEQKKANDYDLADINADVILDANEAEANKCSEANPHVITGKTEKFYIYVKDGTHFIELKGVNIFGDDSPAVGIANGATVHLILANDSENILKTKISAGISVPTGATLNISGEGKLISTGVLKGAGIGASGLSNNQDAGKITIDGGTIIATGGSNGAAGIGGGNNGAGGEIIINGGTITATGGSYGAGIGGGNEGASGIITINGGEVTANGGSNGSGIGGGYNGAGGTITISGASAKVIATGGSHTNGGGAGIGSGSIWDLSTSVNGGTIAISGGEVKATGGMQGAGIGGGSGANAGTITISGNTTKVIATSDSAAAGIGDGNGNREGNGSAIVSISADANVTAVSAGDSAILAETITGIEAYILHLDFSNEVAADLNVEVLKANNEVKASYTPTIKFKSIAFAVPKGTYKATLGEKALEHGTDSPYSEEFTISNSGLTKFNNVKVKVGGSTTDPEPEPEPEPEPDPNPEPEPEPNPTPTPPSTGGSSSNTSNNIGAEGTESGSSVKVTTTRTPDEVKDIIEDKYIIDTIEIKKTEEPVKIKIKVDKKKTKDIFVVQTNPETKKVELVAKSEVDNKGYAEFMTDSKEKLTIVTQLYVGFIDTVATVVKPSVTYYIDETQTFKKGWFKLEDKDWYFADYLSEEVQKNRWVADGEDSNKLAKWYYLGEDGVMFEGKWIANDEDGTKWYYVDQNGLFLRDTVIDGYVINSEGYWSK